MNSEKKVFTGFCDRDGNPIYFFKIAKGKTHYLTKEEVEKFNSLVKFVGARI